MRPPIENSTLSATDVKIEPSDRRSRPYLFLVLESHRPLASSVRVALDGLDEVVLGRGSTRAIEIEYAGGVRRLRVRLDDKWLSTHHARLTRVHGRWVFEDTDSKNGSVVDGVRQPKAELTDGALIELSGAFFLYRDAVPCAPDAPSIVDSGTLTAPAQAFVTLSPPLAQTFERLAVVARSQVSVILEGQTGTGKEVVARAIHDVSKRPGTFVAINCGALPHNLIEAELFGHRKGAFSGATEERPGLVRVADGGTLLLDEIGDFPASSQATVLRALQEHEVRPVGGTRPVQVDLRVVAATHRRLDQMVERGGFRADLLARLAGYRIELPPLSARREDMGLLLAALIRRRADPSLAARLQIHPVAVRAMLRYEWPHNVRELEQCVATALSLAQERGRIELEHLPEPVRRAAVAPPAVRRDEGDSLRDKLVALMRQHCGNVTAVARATGKARMQIQRWLKRYDIDPEPYRR